MISSWVYRKMSLRQTIRTLSMTIHIVSRWRSCLSRSCSGRFSTDFFILPHKKSCRRRQSRRFVFSSPTHFPSDFSFSLRSRCCSSYRSVKSHVCNIFKLKICSGREWGRTRMMPTWVASSLWWARDNASESEAEKKTIFKQRGNHREIEQRSILYKKKSKEQRQYQVKHCSGALECCSWDFFSFLAEIPPLFLLYILISTLNLFQLALVSFEMKRSSKGARQ